MSIRILYLIESLEPSGVARQLTLAAEGVGRANFEVRVVTIQAPRPEQYGSFTAELAAAGVVVDDCGGRWPTDPRALFQLRQVVSDWRPELIHSWDRTSGVYAHLVLVLPRRLATSPAAAPGRPLTRCRNWSTSS